MKDDAVIKDNEAVYLRTEPDGRSKFSLEFENGGC